MISTYRVSNSAYYFDGSDNAILNLSRVNIFVGANNSGKSRLLRQLFITDHDVFLLQEIDLAKVNGIIETLKLEISQCITSQNGLVDVDGVLSMLEQLQPVVWVTKGERFLKPLTDALNQLRHTAIKDNVQPRTQTLMAQPGILWSNVRTRFREIVEKHTKTFQELTTEFDKETVEFRKVYIPTLRGLRGDPVHTDSGFKDIYAVRTAKDYFLREDAHFNEYQKFNIFTGLTLYEEITDLLLGDSQDRDIVNKFQAFLSKAFFDGQEVVLIPKRKHDVLNVRIGHEEKPIYDLGDGIQSLIIMTFPMFKYENENVLFFIEEPEQYLHPGMQRKFLQTLLSFTNHQFFLTTHSNHLLDLTLDYSKISVYKFCKSFTENGEPLFSVENVSNDDTSVLELLGVQNSSVLLSNCTIWVEGITDRLYLRKYFDLYQRNLNGQQTPFKEDVHFSFVEYGGGNITHWSFLDSDDTTENGINVERVCSRLFLIADSDGDKKEPRHARLQERLGERYYRLPCKEVENLLSTTVLNKVIADYERVSVASLEFKTSGFTMEAYAQTGLGQFIDNQLIDKRRRGSYASDSGTVSDKTGFCRRAIKNTNDFCDMSPAAITLCKELYAFIQRCNPDVPANSPQE